MRRKTLTLLAVSVLALSNSSMIISQTCRIKTSTLTNGCPVYTEVFEYDYVQEKPEYPGGGSALLNFINSTREYPREAYEKGIEGRVTCAFVVNPDGKVSNVQVLRGVEPSLNNEAIRVLEKMPDWKPGKIEGKTVPVRVVYCVKFRK